MRNEQLIQTLYDCAKHCFNCADACLDEDDVKKMVECIRLDKICGATCTATAEALAVRNNNSAQLVKACAEICEKCADECASHEADHCKACAEACRKCAEACRSYSA
jgi:hypothetical protein